MTLYSYVVAQDTGFSPNPFFGYCTLACCKPGIRRKAQKGDWVVGLTPKADGNRIVFFMRIDEEPIGFDAYWQDARFKLKRPRYDAGISLKCGDNIYQPQPEGGYHQLRSTHSDKHKADDLSGEYVLISETFAYFGSEAIELPPELRPLIVQRGYRRHFSDYVKAEFLRFVGTVGLGVRARPRRWPPGDGSWVKACGLSDENNS